MLINKIPASYRGFFYRAYREYKDLNSKAPFDVVHSQSSAALAWLFRSKKKLIVTMHGNLFTESQLNKEFFNKKNFIDKVFIILKLYKSLIIHFLTKKLLVQSNSIIVPTEFSKKQFSNNKIDKKIRIINHGINDDLLKRESKEIAKGKFGWNGKQVLLCLGRLIEEKGFQIAIEALANLNKEFENLILVIVGKGNYETEIKKKIQELNVKNVIFVGYVNDEEKYLYYSAADIFIYPELTQPAFGLVAAEAMSCGTPVIASQHEAIREVLGSNEMLFRVGDWKELAIKISNYLRLTEDQQAIINNKCFERQKKYFSLDSMVKRTIDTYKI